eukprot:scaffold1282_cov251-Pinguiococcus_pyrenoidosus.AAC.45
MHLQRLEKLQGLGEAPLQQQSPQEQALPRRVPPQRHARGRFQQLRGPEVPLGFQVLQHGAKHGAATQVHPHGGGGARPKPKARRLNGKEAGLLRKLRTTMTSPAGPGRDLRARVWRFGSVFWHGGGWSRGQCLWSKRRWAAEASRSCGVEEGGLSSL